MKQFTAFWKKSGKLNANIKRIPAHLCNGGNEKADKLAKNGTESQNTIINKLRITDANNTIQEKMVRQAKEWYQTECTQKGKNLRNFTRH